MGKPGQQSAKGVPENRWSQPKDTNVSLTMTQFGRDALKERLKEANISLSELLELWGRRHPVDDDSTLAPPKPEKYDLSTILDSLSDLSVSELGRLGKAVIELLMTKRGQ